MRFPLPNGRDHLKCQVQQGRGVVGIRKPDGGQLIWYGGGVGPWMRTITKSTSLGTNMSRSPNLQIDLVGHVMSMMTH